MQSRRRKPRQRAAKAIADDADLPRGRRRRPRCFHVEQHVVEADLLRHRPPGFRVGLRIVEIEAWLVAVEDSRRDAVVAVRRPAVGDAADMRVDAENLLDDDQPAAMLAACGAAS